MPAFSFANCVETALNQIFGQRRNDVELRFKCDGLRDAQELVEGFDPDRLEHFVDVTLGVRRVHTTLSW